MKELIWDEWNLNHIKKHKVYKNEVEEAFYSKVYEGEIYSRRKIIFGKTNKGRLLIIIISFLKQKNPYVVSARDMNKKERRIYYEKTKTD